MDGTDFYMFRSYEPGRENYVTLIANYHPLQDPIGGPNYFFMDDDALYEIHIDNDGDAREDLTFQFRFNNRLNGPNGLEVPVGDGKTNPIGFPALGPIVTDQDRATNQHILETYTVDVVHGNRRTSPPQMVRMVGTGPGGTSGASGGGGTVFQKPFDYIGTKTFPDYEDHAARRMYEIAVPGCQSTGRLFVGQRKESFAINVGVLFDLVNAPASVITDPAMRDAAPNPLANKNITTFALELPIECVTKDPSNPIIGGWTTASKRQARVLNPDPTFDRPTREGGAWVQVSRLGMPLVNEVVVGVADKNRFNSSHPSNDAQFLDYVTHPTLPVLLQALFGLQPPPVPRNDLVAVFLTGVPQVNENGATAEYLRLNTALPPTPAASQNSLGAAQCFVDGALTLTNPGCDPAGFPNGRRPGDDVVDISLTVAGGFLIPGALQVPLLHDAVLQEAAQFDAAFPYLRTPMPGAGGPSSGRR
ncbi:MAG: DUF4331 domain-containing protein [Myxococcota bacterium]|nr:DUF4331 domain-containing protein [Myxococcota bacterium]